MSYRGFYVNLDKSLDRRIFIEHELRQNGVLERYTRVPAIDGSQLQMPTNSKLTKAEIACRTSHINILRDNATLDKHIHIIEDDIELSSHHHKLLEGFFAQNQSWDILFTGLQIPLVPKQITFITDLYEKLHTQKHPQNAFFNMRDFLFVGAFSYIINKKSIGKFLKIYEQADANSPIDFIFREYICFRKELKGYCAFPFGVKHAGVFDTTMGERKFELTYEYQYLFQKAFFYGTSLQQTYKDIAKYAKSIGYTIQDNTVTIKNIYQILYDMSRYITNSSSIEGKCG